MASNFPKLSVLRILGTRQVIDQQQPSSTPHDDQANTGENPAAKSAVIEIDYDKLTFVPSPGVIGCNTHWVGIFGLCAFCAAETKSAWMAHCLRAGRANHSDDLQGASDFPAPGCCHRGEEVEAANTLLSATGARACYSASPRGRGADETMLKYSRSDHDRSKVGGEGEASVGCI